MGSNDDPPELAAHELPEWFRRLKFEGDDPVSRTLREAQRSFPQTDADWLSVVELESAHAIEPPSEWRPENERDERLLAWAESHCSICEAELPPCGCGKLHKQTCAEALGSARLCAAQLAFKSWKPERWDGPAI